MYKDVRAVLEGFSSPGELFTQLKELNPTEIVNEESYLEKKPYNGSMPLLMTQPYLPCSPQ